MSAPGSSLRGEVLESERWLHEIMDELDLADERRALRVLRAGLHTIRDRLPTIEAVELAAGLPTLLRGLFYEGWRLPTALRPRDRGQIVASMRARLGRVVAIDAEDALGAVIRVLERHRRGDLLEIYASLPQPMAELWSESAAPARGA
jgi:uncharacterized protein (DUF2267 family)